MKEKKRVPKLRFPGFEGEWEERRLGQVCQIQTGSKDTQDKVDDGLYPFYVRSNTIERINSYSFDKDAILTSGDGAGVGKIYHLVNGKFEVHQRVYALTNFKSKFSIEFTYHFFSEKFYKRVMRLSAKNSVDSVRRDMIFDMIMPHPQIAEQQKIATFLTSIDTRIQQLEKKKTLLEQYKKGVMQKIFKQEIRFRDDDGKEFVKWERKRLGDVADINPSNTALPEEFIYIDLESVEKGRLIQENIILKKDAPSRAQRHLKPNDILFQMVRPYQMNNLLFNREGDYVASTGYALLRTKEIPQYIYFYLHLFDFVNKVIERSTGTSYPAINSSDLASIIIKVPCLEEQTKIAHFLTALDTKIAVTAQQVEETKKWKKGLLQQMFV